MDNGRYFVGEDLKFKITLEADGFVQDEDDYTIEFICGTYTHTYTQDDIVKGADGCHYLLIPTVNLTPGMMKMIITVFVPDGDFPDAVRKEVESITLGPLKPVK